MKMAAMVAGIGRAPKNACCGCHNMEAGEKKEEEEIEDEKGGGVERRAQAVSLKEARFSSQPGSGLGIPRTRIPGNSRGARPGRRGEQKTKQWADQDLECG